MAYDEIKLDYGLAEAMAQTFGQGAQELQATLTEMHAIAGMLEEGALLGRGGTAYVEAIRSQLSPSLTILIEKFEELKGDVEGAINDMRDADARARGQFAG